MVMHNCEYVATASMAFMDDYYDKLEKAITAANKGMAFIHIFSPCPTGWRYPPGKLIEISRKAVQTNMVPLWEFTSENGYIQFTQPVDDPLPVQEYLSLVGKYRHLNDEQLDHIQKTTDDRIALLKKFSVEYPGDSGTDSESIKTV
jgi:phenylglyoxylate dehydrogenase beta subunit